MDLGRILDAPMDVDVMEDDKIHVIDRNSDLWLPVPMTELQKTLTDQVVSLHYSDILKLFETNEPVMPESLETLYTNSQLVCSHPYLLVEDELPHNLLLKDVPAVLARESGKFKVLGDLLDSIKDEKIDIALFAKPGKTFDLIEAYILGRFINYRRYYGENLKEYDDDEAYSTVHLIPSSQLDSQFRGEEKFGFVIAFDQTFNESDAHVVAARNNKRDSPAPIIRLIAQNSVEHISLKFKQEQNERLFLRHVLAAVVVLRGEVGTIPNHVTNLYDQELGVLLEWYHKTTGWPMPELPHVSAYNSLDVEKSLLTEFDHENRDTSSAEPRNYYQAKRLKREPAVMPQETKSGLSHSLLTKLEEVLRENELKSAELENLRLQASQRQEAFENLHEDMADKIREIQELRNRVLFAEKRADRKANEVEKNQQQVEQLSAQLAETKALFEETPDQKRLLEQEEKIKQLESDLEKANERIKNLGIEGDFTRAEYQKASSAAADAAATIQDLKQQQQVLQTQADGKMVELRKLTFDQERQEKDDRIKELQAQLEMLQEHLKRVLEGDKARSRLGSRASSVPRNTLSPSRAAALNSSSSTQNTPK